MITWTCKTLMAASALAAITGCDGMTSVGLPAAQPTPFAQAQMMSGAVTLVPPHGYCIDSSSLKPRFALMARCDALDEEAGTGGAAIGVITASLSKLPEGGTLPAAQDIAELATLTNLRDAQQSKDRISFRADGPAPGSGYSKTQWRSVAIIGKIIIGLTLRGPEDGRALSTEGREMLNEMITRTRAAAQ